MIFFRELQSCIFELFEFFNSLKDSHVIGIFTSVNEKSMVRNLLIVCSVLIAALNSLAQEEGTIVIHADSRIETLIKKQGSVVSPATSPQISGYRLQLMFDSDRKKIDETRARFENIHPEIPTYVVFSAPNYLLKAGDYRSQLEAEKLKMQIFSEFPTSFVVKESVNLPKID